MLVSGQSRKMDYNWVSSDVILVVRDKTCEYILVYYLMFWISECQGFTWSYVVPVQIWGL